MIGTTELLLIGGIALLMFGGKKLPEMMRGLGQGVKEFKEGLKADNVPQGRGVEDSGEDPKDQKDNNHITTLKTFRQGEETVEKENE